MTDKEIIAHLRALVENQKATIIALHALLVEAHQVRVETTKIVEMVKDES